MHRFLALFYHEKQDDDASPTVVVEDHDFHDAGPAQLDLAPVLGRQLLQLEEKLLIRLPLVVVHNGDFDLQHQSGQEGYA